MKNVFLLFLCILAASCGTDTNPAKITPTYETPREKTQREYAKDIAIDLATGQCTEKRMLKIAENSKAYCWDWWEPIPYGDTPEQEEKFIKNYPSSEICDCFAQMWVDEMPETLKRKMAEFECTNNKIWSWGTLNNGYGPQFEQFAEKVWDACDKQASRWVDTFIYGTWKIIGFQDGWYNTNTKDTNYVENSIGKLVVLGNRAYEILGNNQEYDYTLKINRQECDATNPTTDCDAATLRSMAVGKVSKIVTFDVCAPKTQTAYTDCLPVYSIANYTFDSGENKYLMRTDGGYFILERQ